VLIWSPLVNGHEVLQRVVPIGGAELVNAGGIYSLLALGFGGVLALVLGDGVPAARSLFSVRALRWLGTRSYGLYLYHGITVQLTQALLRPWLLERMGDRMTANLTGLALSVAGLLLLSELSFRFFERPLLALRSRFEPAPADSLRAEPLPAYDRAPS